MKMITGYRKMRVWAATLSLVTVSGMSAADEPFTGNWRGGSTQFLSHGVNWVGGVVPGRVQDSNQSPFATNGTWGCVMVFGDVDSSWPYDLRTAGDGFTLLSTGKMIFRGSSLIQHYTFNWQSYRIESGGGIFVESDAAHVPYFVENSSLHFVKAPGTSDTVTLSNDSSAGPLLFRDMNTESFSGWAVRPTVRLEGRGDICFAGYVASGSGWIDLVVAQSDAGKTVFTNASNSGVWTLTIPSSESKRTIEITDTSILYTKAVGGDAARPVVVETDAEIIGSGTLYFGKGWNDSANIYVTTGKTLSWGVDMENYGSYGGTVKPLRVLGGGTLALSGSVDNRIPGNVMVLEGSKVSTPAIGAAGASSPLGTGSSVTLQDGSCLAYVGNGEPTGDRALAFSTGGGTFAHLGSGTLALGNVTVDDGCEIIVTNNATLVLASLTRTAGDVSVVLRVGATLTVGNMTAGKGAEWLTVNGLPARVTASRNVVGIDSDADVSIDARGGQIPNVPEGTVDVATAQGSTDGVTLAESQTSVYVLTQKQSVQPAVVTVGSGERLSAEIVRVVDGAQPLVVVGDGDFSGAMRLYGGELVRSNATTGASVALASKNTSASVVLAGALSAESPLALSAVGDSLSVAGTGNVPISWLEALKSSELTIDGVSAYETSAVAQFSDSTYTPPSALNVGTNSQGILSFDGGCFTGRVSVGIGTSAERSAKGAIYQTGGEICNVVRGDTDSLPYGYYGYAYIAVAGGRFVQTGDWYLGGNFGETVVDVRGGTFCHVPESLRRSYLRIGGWDTLAVLYVADGGVFDASMMSGWTVMIPSFNRYNSNCEVTIGENGYVDFGAKEVCLGSHAEGNSSYRQYVVNLNGGTLKTSRLCRSASEVQPSEDFPEGTGGSNRANSFAFVNANGGTLMAVDASAIFGSRTTPNTYPITRVTAFEKGLTIDTGNGLHPQIGVGGGIKAPYGKGIVNIAWDAATDGIGYIGAPVVLITGDGQGASAFACFDSNTRMVTNVIVTSHGNGYTWAKANITYGRNTVKTIDCELADNVSGGLTVCGSGALHVYGTNTYTGATMISGGMAKVVLKADDVFSSESSLVLDGGELDMENHHQMFSGFSATGNGGRISNGTVTISGLTVDFGKAAAGDVGAADFTNVSFPAGAVVKLVNYDATALSAIRRLPLYRFLNGAAPATSLSLDPSVELPKGWGFYQDASGLYLKKPHGACVSFR